MERQELIALLDEKIPRDAIASREGGNGRKLDYLEGWYVIDRLNKVIGHGKWAYKSEATKVGEQQTKDRYDKIVYSVHYVARVSLVAVVDGEPTEFQDYGYGDGTDKAGFGKAHELAIKEAVTDGLKRCAKNLGMSFGLALYDKSQENVSEDAPPPSNDAPPAAKAKVAVKPDSALSDMPRDRLMAHIVELGMVLESKKIMSLDEMFTEMKKNYGAEKKEDLTPDNAVKFAVFLKGKLK